jgi:phage repressor protein C with HTH and peptisase S24 domain
VQIIDELQNIIKEKGYSVLQFAKEADISAYKVYKWFEQKGNPKHEDVMKIEKWLNNLDNVPHEKSSTKNEVNEQSAPTYLESRRNQKNNVKAGPYMVPLIPVKAQAGYVKAFDQEVYIDTLDKYALPPGVNPQGAIWRYWEVEGDSMDGAFNNGDIILTSQVHQMDWENLRNFYIYVIVTADRVLIKRIYCKNELEWVLISENEDHYPQQLLPVEYIKEVWVYRRSIVNKVPPTKRFEINV